MASTSTHNEAGSHESDTAGHLTPAALAELLSQIKQAKADASEASGEAGSLTKQACERFGIEKKALGLIVSLSKIEDAPRQAILRSLFQLIELSGWFDQGDLFDDLKETLLAILKKGDVEKPKNVVKARILNAAA